MSKLQFCRITVMLFPTHAEAEQAEFPALVKRLREALLFAKERRFAPDQQRLVKLLSILELKIRARSESERIDAEAEFAGVRFQIAMWVFASVGFDTNKIDPQLAEHKCPASRRLAAQAQTLPQLLTIRVPWELLPPGEIGDLQLRDYFRDFAQRHPNQVVHLDRIDFALSLRPDRRIVGKATGEFDGYVAFTFPFTNKVLLECPHGGNAAYVLGEDWEELSQLTKAELRRLGDGHSARRIIHGNAGWWRTDIRNALRPMQEQPRLPLL